MSKSTYLIKKLVLIAVLGASLNVVKFALMYIPNVEAVTLFIVIYTYVFGLTTSIPATLVFCVIEGFLFGFDPSWLIAYFIHWPFIAVVAAFCKLLKIKFPLLIAVIIGLATALFGFQSTFIYYWTGGAIGKPGWVDRYWMTYMAGIWFYVAEVASALVMITFLFKPLVKVLTKLKCKYYNIAESTDSPTPQKELSKEE